MSVDLLLDGNRPPVGAYGAEPLTLAEIDAHPDGNRIWATILQMREAHQDVFDEFESDQIEYLTDDWEAERKEHDQEVESLRDVITDLENELSEFREAA